MQILKDFISAPLYYCRLVHKSIFMAQVWGASVGVIIVFLLFYLIQYDNSLIHFICKSEINNYLPPLTNKIRRKNEKHAQIKMDLVRFWARRQNCWIEYQQKYDSYILIRALQSWSLKNGCPRCGQNDRIQTQSNSHLL